MNEVRKLLEASSLPGGALAGRTAVVTGAGRGIGASLAEALALLGAHVVVAELDGASGDAVAQSIRAHLGRMPRRSCRPTSATRTHSLR